MNHTMPAPTPLEGAGALVSTAGVDVTVDQLSDEEQAGTGRALSVPHGWDVLSTGVTSMRMSLRPG